MGYERLNQMLNQVKPSQQQEEAMLKHLLQKERTESDMKTKHRMPKMAAAMLAAAILTTSAFAAVATGLDQRLLQYFGAEPEQTELLSPAAVVVDKELKDQGTTLRIEQAIADRYSAVVLIDLTTPEGTVLDGDYYTLGERDRLRARTADGTEMDSFGVGWTLLEDEDSADNHISLLLTVRSINGEFNFLGSKLSMDFEGLYDSNVQKNVLVDGHWKCTINLPQEDPGIYTVSDVPIEIGESQITLHSLYLSPISLTWELQGGKDNMESVAEIIHDTEDWQNQITLTTAESETIPVGECNFLHTTYGGGEGRYCFRLDTIMDPVEVVSVTLFGQTFSLK